MPRIDSLEELIRLSHDARAEMIHTAIPGKVVLYDSLTATAKVQPVVTQPVKTEDNPLLSMLYELRPLLHDVLVCFPQGGLTSITWPINPGDHLIVIFSEADISKWVTTGSISNPDTVRRHGLSGGMGLPQINPLVAPLTSTVDPALVITSAQIKLGGVGATDFVALASLVLAELTAIQSALDNHTHTVPITGPAGSTASAPSLDAGYVPTPVAATTTKAL